MITSVEDPDHLITITNTCNLVVGIFNETYLPYTSLQLIHFVKMAQQDMHDVIGFAAASRFPEASSVVTLPAEMT